MTKRTTSLLLILMVCYTLVLIVCTCAYDHTYLWFQSWGCGWMWIFDVFGWGIAGWLDCYAKE